MPYGNKGFDFICCHNKNIDVKSSCLRKSGGWIFHIDHNIVADYFLCIAFDNRDDLTPLHVWLIPGSTINHLQSTGISPSTVHRWDEYMIDHSKISTCFSEMNDRGIVTEGEVRARAGFSYEKPEEV